MMRSILAVYATAHPYLKISMLGPRTQNDSPLEATKIIDNDWRGTSRIRSPNCFAAISMAI
jgi:hypothetical protein